MDKSDDIRWLQRLENYRKAFYQLQVAINKYKESGLNDLEKQGLIKSFEYNFELAWNLIRDFFLYQGILEIRGSRDAFRFGFKYGIIDNGEIWLNMIEARNLSFHTYNEKIIDDLLKEIIEVYFFEFKKLLDKFLNLKESK